MVRTKSDKAKIRALEKQLKEVTKALEEVLPKPECEECGGELEIGDTAIEVDSGLIHEDCASTYLVNQNSTVEITLDWLKEHKEEYDC